MSHSPPPGTPKARIPGPQQPPPPYPRIAAGLWRRCLGGGLALWVLITWVTYETRNSTLLPTPILLGSFLVPVAFVLWAYERHCRDLGVSAILGCFLAGGTLGVLGASLTESNLLQPSPGTFAGVGLIEEAAKLAALVFVLRRQPAVRGLRAGLVLGAAVGCGFAALESAGYAVNAALSSAAVSAEGVDLRTLLQAELPRGLLGPFGHGLWTAIAGGVLLSRRRLNGYFRLSAPVAGTCLGVALLHALGDATHGAALWSVARLTGTAPEGQLFAPGYLVRPSAAQEPLFTLFSVGGLALVALAGVGWLRSLARRDPSW
ncbi:PrsW family intramembrane metalloprotease [Streptomyces barringtoniae]|uniref:PrsW family intramembrane metalloprotease n=1 Tax=Streptomyces barringtoniae TaxID=2892029 RepID=UPI001E2AF7DE|nr:PrsW family glutamic-type intramembrane protease [Streptomyces barringtoniae]MCC5477287.1 PrsW family intramembrane metalloprotease [Streptomyces barringtoniae]